MRTMPDIERRVLAVLQKGLPRSLTPYKDIAEQIGINTAELLAILEAWKQQGKIRRLGAIVNHLKIGISSGAMVAWQIEPERIAEAGKILAGFEQVTHAYQRSTCEGWAYNFYTMVHGKNDEELGLLIKRMSGESAVSNYRILETEKELKKTAPTYIME